MTPRIARWCAAVVVAMGGLSVPLAQTADRAPDRAFIDRYCVSCHSGQRRAGGLVFDRLDPARVGEDAKVFETIARQVRSGTMPPPGAARPDRAAAIQFAVAVERALDRASLESPNPGRPLVRRLTRVEYANAVRDLLALEVDAESLLPADETLDGFDNNGGALSTSPALLERYLAAARRISRIAVGDRGITAAFASMTYATPQTLWQDGRMSEDLPFGSRGGVAIRHQFPLDGNYIARVRLRKNILGYIRGLGERHRLEVRLDGRRVGGFEVGGEKKGQPAPLSFAGLFSGDPGWEAYALAADEHLDVTFAAKAGMHVLGVSFVEELAVDDGVLQPPLTGLAFSYDESRTSPTGPRGPAVDSVTIDGPHSPTGSGDTPSRARVFLCRPEASKGVDACAREIFSTLGRRAYRRALNDRELDTLLGFFRTGMERSGFEEGVRSGLERMLVDPAFLFRLEKEPPSAQPGGSYRVSDIDLASRLSFFLWSTVPDDRLLDLAAANGLSEPATLDAEVRRMMADRRASSLVSNFATQWLSLRRLRDSVPDPALFADFDGNLRDAFERETELFVDSQIREDRGLLELLTANYTFLNERLARHYGIPNVYGNHFRRVTLDTPARGGLLGQGGILTLTSQPRRTSPVLRGRWVLDTILGTPPPPPPPDIPALPAAAADGKALSVRARTERHRANPVCASCHARTDPLGFALENFDATGRWRVSDDDGSTLDASAVFPDGTKFTGIAGLRQVVASRPDEFARTVVEKLLVYALGRRLEYYDMPSVRRVVSTAAADNYRWSSIIRGVVSSIPFQMKRAS